MKVYVRCLNSKNCKLVENFEYEVLETKQMDGFGDTYFLLLSDGLWYAGCHFSVTYYK